MSLVHCHRLDLLQPIASLVTASSRGKRWHVLLGLLTMEPFETDAHRKDFFIENSTRVPKYLSRLLRKTMFRPDRYPVILLFIGAFVAMAVAPATFAAGGPPGPSPTYCSFLEVGGPYYYATPVVLLNSPYLGSASATSSVSYTSYFSLGGPESSTSTITGYSISASNGQSDGLFQIDGWYMYAHYCPNFVGYAAKIGTTTVNGTTLMCTAPYILLSGTRSDAGEPTQTSCTVDCNTYQSISFNNGYSSANEYLSTCSGVGTTAYTSTTTEVGYSLTVSGGGYTSVSGTASLTSLQTQAYQYTFPGGYQWAIQYVGSNSGSAWSFDFVGC